MLRGFFGNLIFTIIARMLCGHRLNNLKNSCSSFFFSLKFLDGSYGHPEIILNQNELRERYSYVSIPLIKMSPSRRVRNLVFWYYFYLAGMSFT